ncbi:hypothetical protein N8819_03270, partial [Gammaproteobacteria bacterium]|nr:hypothetical protein [Gammaproteobacteria bacterium]
MTNFYKYLFLLFTVLSLNNISADERAPRSQCYINGGWALENTLESKIRELDVRIESLELYIRSDNKIYLTLGKIDRDLYRNLRNTLGSSYSCSSGKGYLKRVSVNENFQIIRSGLIKGRVIESASDLSSLLLPTLSSYIAAQEKSDRLAEEKAVIARIANEKLKEIELQKIQVSKNAEKKAAEETRITKTHLTQRVENIGLLAQLESSDSIWEEFFLVIKFIFLTIPKIILESLAETFGIKIWQVIAILFFISWAYIKAKKAYLKKKATETANALKKVKAKEAKRRRDIFKKFEKDYPNVEPSIFNMESDKYLKTKSELEQAKILDNLKELEIK